MITNIQLTNFRKFKSFQLSCNQKVVIITGQNGSGKTSILEAIYLTSTSKSHRIHELDHLILEHENYAVVELDTDKHFRLVLSKEGKNYAINDVPYQKLSDFIGQLSVILFSPLDIDLIRGSKAIRRHFLDLQISLLDKNYLRLITEYKHLIKERNDLLKQYTQEKSSILDIITTQIIERMKPLYQKRCEFIKSLNEELKQVCNTLECEHIALHYKPTYLENQMLESFRSRRNIDLATKTTGIGLHRDDFTIELNGFSALTYGSEGQIRTTALAIQLALKNIYQKNKKQVILLLDDVFASLDQKRINHIMNYIKNEHQTFITTTSLFNIPDGLLKDAKIVKL